MIELNRTLEGFVREMKLSHPETFYHSLRVKNLTAEMLRRANQRGMCRYGEGEVNSICKGALLHDIGKLRVSNALLTKSAALRHAEMDQLREHARLGAEMVAQELKAEERETVQNICRFHHERLDGSGYAGKRDLPLYVRMVALCDVFDALQSDRVYRQGIPAEKAFQMLYAGECGKLDADLIRLLEEMICGRKQVCGF